MHDRKSISERRRANARRRARRDGVYVALAMAGMFCAVVWGSGAFLTVAVIAMLYAAWDLGMFS